MNAVTNKTHNRLGLLSAKLFSDSASFAILVASVSFIYLSSQSVAVTALFYGARIVGIFIGSLLAPLYYRRFNRKAGVGRIDFVRAALVAVLIFLPLTGKMIFCLPVISLLLGAGHSLFSIGVNMSAPRLFAAEALLNVNAQLVLMSSLGVVVGSLCGGIVLAIFSVQTVFAMIALAYFASFIAMTQIDAVQLSEPTPTLAPTAQQKPKYLQQFTQVREFAQQNPVWKMILLLAFVDTLGSSAHNVGKPILAKLIDPANASTVMGAILAAWALGRFLGARGARSVGSMGSMGSTGNLLERCFFVGVLLMSTSFITLFFQSDWRWAVIVAVFAGAGDGLAEVALVTMAQKSHEDVRLSLLSFVMSSQYLGFSIGVLLCTPVFGYFSHPATVVALFHALPILLSSTYLLKAGTAEVQRT